ncbi:LuxR C-terminal-related transcriptional regulator [Labilibaculum sp.]|uniref:LuxR C-terminal-related transcriptional regulator n=1 Tax=Labilibaculum sp. TaxID=2060723 RepID=UPI003561E62F
MKKKGTHIPNNSRKKCFLIVVLLFFQVHLFGTNHTQNDTNTINLLTHEAYQLARINPEHSISIAYEALHLSQKQNFKKGIADANLALGAAFMAKYNPMDSASFYFHKALEDYSDLQDFTGMARACYGLSFLYNFKNNAEEALIFATRSVNYFEQSRHNKEKIAALSALIYLERKAGNYEKSLRLSVKAINTAQSVKDTSQWANAINDRGHLFKDMFLFNQAIDSYFEAFRLWEEKNDSSGLAIAFGSIANLYFYQEDYKKSLEFNLKKLEIIKTTKNLWETSKTLNNTALSYSNLGQHAKALAYMRKSLSLSKKLNYSEGIALSYNKIGETFLKMGEADSAFFYSTKAVLIAQEQNSKKLADYLVTQASALEKQNKYKKALSTAKKAHSLAKDNNNQQTILSSAFLLNQIYYQMGRADLAYPFLAEHIKLNDSINNKAFMRKVTRLDLQHEYDKKQRIIQYKLNLLDKDNQIKTERLRKTWILFLALLLLTVAGTTISFLTIRNKNHHIEQMKLEIRNYLLHLEKHKVQHENENPIRMLVNNYGLTQREAEIMELIATGIGNKEIAERLFISKNTIKFHIKNIFIKLDVRNRVQALQKIAG